MKVKKLLTHIIALGAVVMALCLAMFFIRTTFVQPATAKTSGYFISDVFDSPGVEFAHNKTVEQPFTAIGNLYGVRVRFHNAGKPQAGSFYAELVDPSTGGVLAQATGNTETLLNDSYSAIHFDTPHISNGRSDYILRITPTFATENAYMRIWSSAESGSIAFGVISYVADAAAVYRWFDLLWLVVVTVAVVLYAVCFIFKFKKENVFLVALLAVSLVFTMVLPPFSSPDEEGHFSSAYQLANRIEGEGFKWTNNLMRRTEDFDEIFEDRNTTVFSYEYIYKNFFSKAESDEAVFTTDNWIVNDFEGVYAAGAAGILLGKLFNLGYVPMMYLGRFLNLMVFALCAYFAVKITPLGKEVFMAVSFLPITLHIVNSFSRDVFVISIGFIFAAYLLKLWHQQEKYTAKQLILLAVITALLAPSKYIYILMCPLVLLLKKENFTFSFKGGKKTKWIVLAVVAVLFGAVAVFMLFNNGWLVDYVKNTLVSAESLETLLATNPDATFNLGLLLHNPMVALRLFISTVFENGAFYIRSILGGVLGYNSIFISEAFLYVIFTVVVLSTCCTPSDSHTLRTRERAGLAAAFMLVFAAVVYVAVCWTPVSYTSLYGLQGKYLLPALPLLLLACKNRVITITKDIFRQLCFAIAFTDVFVALNALVIIVQR